MILVTSSRQVVGGALGDPSAVMPPTVPPMMPP
jgi:hypothetical protein